LKKFKEQINVLFESKSRIALICPSEWLLKQVFNGLHTQNLRALRQISNVVQLSTVTRQEDTLEDHSGSVKLLFVAAELGSEVKGLQILLDALSQFHSQTGSNQTIDLTLIGNGKVDFDCLELVRISQIGFVAPSNVHQFMVNSDFLIVPSLSENSPNVVAEAQLLGLPVIASYVSGIPEMVEDSVSGFLFKKDSFDLISTLTRAMNFKDLGTLVSVARDRAEQRHDAKEIFSKHLSIYLDLIA
jgi:glycosyltransferase involved in cell wall biosynthesis